MKQNVLFKKGMLFKNTLISNKKNFYEIECFVQKKNVIQEYIDIVNSSAVRRKCRLSRV